jgi:hypothetical protein
MHSRLAFVSLLAAASCGCSSLLPTGSTDTPSTFASFDQAQAAVEKVVAFRTLDGELKDLGFDVQGRNVTRIPYPDIVARLAPYPGVSMAELDPGIRQCIQAQADCRGYLFHFERQDRRREGGFWADFLNVHRTTNVTGWSLDALIVLKGDTVLFRNYGGQPVLDRVEKQRNPLGPFQPAGEGVGAILVH